MESALYGVYIRTRCFCIRNLTRSLRSLVRFLIRQKLVRKYRTPALSMKYSLHMAFFNMELSLQSIKASNWYPLDKLATSALI